MKAYEELDPGLKESLFEVMKTRSPYWTLLGMELVDVKKGWAMVRLPFDKKLTHPYGIAHGGAIFSAADSAIAMALFGMVDGGRALVTVEMKINYLKPFAEGEIAAEAVIVSKGSTIVLGEAEVRNGEGALVAKAMATYMLIENKGTAR